MMKKHILIDDVYDAIDQTLNTYRKDRDRICSLTEHVHHQSAIDALLILKSHIKLRSYLDL